MSRPSDGEAWQNPAHIPPGRADAPFDIVFLDRDGTINVRVEDGYVEHPDELVLIEGAAEAVARVNAVGARAVLVTNQRGVARGRMSPAQLGAVHDELSRRLATADAHLDAVFVCPHEEGACDCRKPRPGLFHQALAAAPWARAARCLMIGDMPSDVAPARSLGMRAVQLGPGVPTLSLAVEQVLGETR